MEGQAPKAKQLEDSLNQEFRLMLEKNGKVDQIKAHCKLDHMTPHHSQIPQLKKNQSCYLSSYSPSKAHPNYNSSPQAEKELRHFRKYDTNEFTLPAIINDSQYHSSYLGKKTQTTVKCQQKPSFFMKLNWALNPISEYEVEDILFRTSIYAKMEISSTKIISRESIMTRLKSLILMRAIRGFPNTNMTTRPQ